MAVITYPFWDYRGVEWMLDYYDLEDYGRLIRSEQYCLGTLLFADGPIDERG